MQILLSQKLIEQMKSRQIPLDVYKGLVKRLRDMDAMDDPQDLLGYLGNTGVDRRKLMNQDRGRDIWKLRVTDGARLLYQKGGAPEADPEDLVLLEWRDHDHQTDPAARPKQTISLRDAMELLESDYSPEKLENDPNCFEQLYQAAFQPVQTTEGYREYVRSDAELEHGSEIELSESQKACIERFLSRQEPMLLEGSAGSGKTLVAVHVLKDLAGGQAAYFAQSEELRRRAEAMYRELAQKNPDPEGKSVAFYNLNDFALEQLQLPKRSFQRAQGFRRFLEGNESWKRGSRELTPAQVWREIRGELKGSMGWDENRSWPVPQEEISHLEPLLRAGYLRRCDRPKYVTLAATREELRRRLSQDRELRKEAGESLKNVLDRRGLRYRPPLLDRQRYLSQGDGQLTPEQRELVYDIAEAYQNWLETEKYFDDNDLARQLDAEIGPAFDCIVVDEAQDYTLLQLRLLQQMCRGGRMLLFCGDTHQTIQPTVFDSGALQGLFYETANPSGQGGKSKLELRYLQENYRCRACVLNVANAIAELRRKHTFRSKEEIEQEDRAVFSGEGAAYRLRATEENLRTLLQEAAACPEAAVLVADEETKKRLVSLVEDPEAPSFIYTVHEIKGVEYDSIVCYGLMDHYYSELQQILTQGKSRSEARRYYFNFLYVAVTRARFYLGFMDGRVPERLEQAMNLLPYKHYDGWAMGFDRLGHSEADWLRRGREDMEEGRYSDALECLKRGNASDAELYLCQARMAEQEEPGDFIGAGRYYLLTGDWDELCRVLDWAEEDAPGRRLLEGAVRGAFGPGEAQQLLREAFSEEQERQLGAERLWERLIGRAMAAGEGLLARLERGAWRDGA